MRTIRTFNLEDELITAIELSDESPAESLWLALVDDADNCYVRKTNPSNPNQIYGNVSIRYGTYIHSMCYVNPYIALAFTDAVKFAGRLDASWSLSSINYPAGVVESPIQVISDGTYYYFLTPGIDGENAKIIKTTLSLVLDETIDLAGGSEDIFNAIGLTVSGTDLWIVTSESPSKLVRVYQLSGGIYTYTVTSLS